MKSARLFLAFILVGLLCVTAQAQITPSGFQGTFGDIDVSPMTLTAGFTSGSTVSGGISAEFNDLEIDLTGFAVNGATISVSDLVLTGIDGCTGSATYIWDFADLLQVDAIAAGVISGELTLQSGSDLTAASSETIFLPESIAATITYNGVVVSTDGVDGSAMVLEYSSASITAVAVPEPSTIVCLMAGLGTMLLVWRRRK